MDDIDVKSISIQKKVIEVEISSKNSSNCYSKQWVLIEYEDGEIIKWQN